MQDKKPLSFGIWCVSHQRFHGNSDSKVHVANMGPTWVLSPQVGPMLVPWTLLSGNWWNKTMQISTDIIWPWCGKPHQNLYILYGMHSTHRSLLFLMATVWNRTTALQAKTWKIWINCFTQICWWHGQNETNQKKSLYISTDNTTMMKQTTPKPHPKPVHIHCMYVSDLYLICMYRQVSNIRCTQSQQLKYSHTVLRLSLPNPLIKSSMKMYLEQRRQAMLQLHLSDRQFNCILRSSYIRDLTVCVIWRQQYWNTTTALEAASLRGLSWQQWDQRIFVAREKKSYLSENYRQDSAKAHHTKGLWFCKLPFCQCTVRQGELWCSKIDL